MTLRQHEHLRAEGHARGDGRHVREGHERLENGHLRRIGARRAAGDRVAHHHVIEHVNMVVPDLLDSLGQAGHALRPFAVRDARELDGQLHRRASATRWSGEPSRRAIVRRVKCVPSPKVGCQHECFPAPPTTITLMSSGVRTIGSIVSGESTTW